MEKSKDELISENNMFERHENIVIKQLRVKHILGFIPWYYTVDVLFKDLGK